MARYADASNAGLAAPTAGEEARMSDDRQALADAGDANAVEITGLYKWFGDFQVLADINLKCGAASAS